MEVGPVSGRLASRAAKRVIALGPVLSTGFRLSCAHCGRVVRIASPPSEVPETDEELPAGQEIAKFRTDHDLPEGVGAQPDTAPPDDG